MACAARIDGYAARPFGVVPASPHSILASVVEAVLASAPTTMGKFDSRNTPKMSRRKRQEKKKERVNRQQGVAQMARRLKRASPRNEVFVSYSHRDGGWLKRFETMLKPAVSRDLLTIWSDTHIKAGEDWEAEIKSALARAKVALLLVSSEFLASDFITEHELPALIAAADEGELTLLWAHISACLYEKTELRSYQAAHDPSVPIDTIESPGKQQQEIKAICDQVIEVHRR